MEKVVLVVDDDVDGTAGDEGHSVFAYGVGSAISTLLRQRAALSRLQRRGVANRLIIRYLTERERGISADEWKAIKEQHSLELEDFSLESFQ